jgi:hypothetical protein
LVSSTCSKTQAIWERQFQSTHLLAKYAQTAQVQVAYLSGRLLYCWEDHQNLQQQIHYARKKWRLMYLGGDIGCELTGFGWIWWCELDCRILVRFGKAKICRASRDMRNGIVSQRLQFSKIVLHLSGKTIWIGIISMTATKVYWFVVWNDSSKDEKPYSCI